MPPSLLRRPGPSSSGMPSPARSSSPSWRPGSSSGLKTPGGTQAARSPSLFKKLREEEADEQGATADEVLMLTQSLDSEHRRYVPHDSSQPLPRLRD